MFHNNEFLVIDLSPLHLIVIVIINLSLYNYQPLGS
jgi:hypothetical protein